MELPPYFLHVVGEGGHAHHAAQPDAGVGVDTGGERLCLLGQKTLLGLLVGDVDFQQDVHPLAQCTGRLVDFGEQPFGIDGMDHRRVGNHHLDLVGLQVADEMPADVSRKGRSLGGQLLRTVFPEVPLTGLYMNEIVDEDKLPMRFTAYTPCFRREKMSAGRDVRGIKRGHQFDKVEMYCYSLPEKSNEEHERMLEAACETAKLLGLNYRIIAQCTGDLGFNARICYDVEVWAPGCKEWLEVSSVSNDWDFQARRAQIRYRDSATGKPRLLHTLNGSGLGLPRTLIAVMETYQNPDGTITVPEVLKPWMGGIEKIEKED